MQYAEDGIPHYGHADGAGSGIYDPHRQSMMNHHSVYHANHVPIANHVMGSSPDVHKRDKDAIFGSCQVIYSQFGLAIHPNDHQARRRFVERAQNEIAVVPDFHKRLLFSDEAHFWLNGYVNKQNCRIWSEANPQVYVETPLHPEKLTVWCALWAGGILLQKR
ncbi:homothorax-2 [Trichonephila clavipes]|nr:homothorax-2 [Trichonephila clavipes]